MIAATITTDNINGRADWFHAVGKYGDVIYTADMSTRHAAFMDVARQIAVRMERDATLEDSYKKLGV